MSWESFKDIAGSSTDCEGRPYNESFSQKEGKHLKFHQWLFGRTPEDHTPSGSVPQTPKDAPAGALSKFIGKERRR